MIPNRFRKVSETTRSMESRTNAFCMQYCNNKVICYSAANDGHCAVLDDIKHGEPGPRWCRLILSYLLGQTVASPTEVSYIIYVSSGDEIIGQKL